MIGGEETGGDLWAVVGIGEELAGDGGAAGGGDLDLRVEGGGDARAVA